MNEPKERHILLVERERDLRRLMAEQLEKAGYSIVQASDTNEAIDIIKERRPSWFALITSFEMPGINGGDLIKIVRSSGTSFKVIVLVSSTALEEPSVRALLQDESFSVMSKPLVIKELLQLLNCHEI